MGNKEEMQKGTNFERAARAHGARSGLRSGTLARAVLKKLEEPLKHVVTIERKVRGGRSLFIVLGTAKMCTTKSLLTPNTAEYQ